MMKSATKGPRRPSSLSLPTRDDAARDGWTRRVLAGDGRGLSARKGKLGDYDVAGYQVRSVQKLGRSLILHKSDEDDDVFVLAAHISGTHLRLCGWLIAKAGKLPGYWKDPAGGRAAYFVPPSSLNFMSTFASTARVHAAR
jgi:hypothetical protein